MKKIAILLIGILILASSSEVLAQKRHKHSRRSSDKIESKSKKAGSHSYSHKRR